MLRISLRILLAVLVAGAVAALVAGQGSARPQRTSHVSISHLGIPQLQRSISGPNRRRWALPRGQLGPMIAPPFPGERTCFVGAGSCKLHAPRCFVVSSCRSDTSSVPIATTIVVATPRPQRWSRLSRSRTRPQR